MKFDPATGQLIPDSTPNNSFSLWRKHPSEKWYTTFLLFPFRGIFIIFKWLYNSIMFLFKNFSAFFLKVLLYFTYFFVIIPIKAIAFVFTFGKRKVLQDWLESQKMKIDFWRKRGFIN